MENLERQISELIRQAEKWIKLKDDVRNAISNVRCEVESYYELFPESEIDEEEVRKEILDEQREIERLIFVCIEDIVNQMIDLDELNRSVEETKD